MKNDLTPKDYDRWESPPGVFFAIEDAGEEEETQVNKFTITKTEPDKMLVFGWGNVAITKDGEQVTDLQGDVIDPDELEKAAYDHVLNFRNTGERHDPGLRRKGRLVESCVFTKEKQEAMGIPPGTVPEGWWVGYKIDDPDAWEKIKKGDYQMFSIEGKGQRTPIEKSAGIAKSYEEMRKFNPFHDAAGRFSNKNGFSTYSANPNTRAGAMAIARSAAAGHGNTANVHRDSYGENIRQNANWLGRGNQGNNRWQGNATLRARVEPGFGLQGASSTGAAWQAQNQAQGRTTKPGQQPAQQTQAQTQTQQKPAQAQPQQPAQPAQNQPKATAKPQQPQQPQQQPAQNQQTQQQNPKNTGRAPVDGKDISGTFQYNPNGKGSALDQVAAQQGYTGKPTVITDKAEFSQRVAESGVMAYRTINSGKDVKTGAHKTSSQFADDLKNGDEFSFNGSGGQAYGAGLYIAGATSTTKGKGPSRSATNAAKTDSKAYGSTGSKTVSLTLDKSAKVGDFQTLWSQYHSIPASTRSSKYGVSSTNGFAAFCASKGFDALRSVDAGIGCDYYIVYNRTKLIVYDG